MTIFEAYNGAKKRLEAAGIEDTVFEARQIIRHVTGYDNKTILMKYNQHLSEFQENNLTLILKMRENRYPLQYILGEWEFYGLRFFVNVGVLCPRQDTETLVDTALEYLKAHAGASVLELCAGSGCVSVAVAKNCSTAHVTAVEKYDGAFGYLEKNITLNKADNVTALQGDVLDGCGNGGKYDLIVCNPPYIKLSDMESLPPEVKYEPETALNGGDDGLLFYRAISEKYPCCLKSGGMLAFEVGAGQDNAVSEILKHAGFKDIRTNKDLNGIGRVVTGIYHEELK